MFKTVTFSLVSMQFQCDKTKIQTTVGSAFTIICTYKTSQFRFNKKYWCAGDSRASCEVLMDTDGFTQAAYRTRAQIIDGVSRGLIVNVRDLKLDDTGIYWVAIDKIYTDIMTRIQVTVTKGKTLFSSDVRSIAPVILFIFITFLHI